MLNKMKYFYNRSQIEQEGQWIYGVKYIKKKEDKIILQNFA